MIVCAHGDVAEYCSSRDMVVCEVWDGDIGEYRGSCHVLVTDQEMSENEYYYLKGKMLNRGVELISTRHKDNKLLTEFLAYQADRRKKKYSGRQPFGYRKTRSQIREIPEMIAVAKRIIALRDAGSTLRAIREDPEVHHPDGRKISIDTIRQIIVNRKRYEDG